MLLEPTTVVDARIGGSGLLCAARLRIFLRGYHGGALRFLALFEHLCTDSKTGGL